MTKTKRIVIRVSEGFFERASAFVESLKPTKRTKIAGDRVVLLAMQAKNRQDRHWQRRREVRAAQATEEGREKT